MWADPIDMAVVRGENKREAERLGITLEKHLHNQSLKQTGQVEPTPPKTRYIKDSGGYTTDPNELEKVSTCYIIIFLKWVFRID